MIQSRSRLGATGPGPLAPRPPAGRRRAFAAALSLSLVASLATAASTLAHDDPPGHYLETDLLYPAMGDRPSQPVELGLIGLLEAAKVSGYPIRVALVANESDVEDAGMVGQPQAYAELIAADIAFEQGRPVDGPLLVVSPAGFGLAGRELRDGDATQITSSSVERLLAGLSPPVDGSGDSLAAAATDAIRQIARLGGHALPESVPPASAVYRGPAQESPGLDPVPFILFGLLFIPAWFAFEMVSRRRAVAAPSRARGEPTADGSA